MERTIQKEQPKEAQNEQEVVVRAEHLQKSFGAKQVLKDVSFVLHKKENIAILGKSGTGKSVLIKSMVGLVSPSGGRLEVLGQNVLEKKDEEDWEELRRKVAYLFQGGALYDSMTVRENLAFPLKRQVEKMSDAQIEEEVEMALENVPLIHWGRHS